MYNSDEIETFMIYTCGYKYLKNERKSIDG